MEQKTVFISYRLAISRHLARSIYQDLKMNDWDVFLDVNTIDSGDFDRIILNQIAARAHFILLISKGSLERCANSGDRVLREIEEAIRLNRNIVLVLDGDIDFDNEITYLPEQIRTIVGNINPVHIYQDIGIHLLRTRFLKSQESIKVYEPINAIRVEFERLNRQVENEILKLLRNDLLPDPFDWIDVLVEPTTLETLEEGIFCT